MTANGNSGKRRRVHPGSGRRKAPVHPKGRQLDAEDAAQLLVLLGDGVLERPLLIEYLHAIQEAEGCLPAGLMQALAEALKIPMAEVYEVASFYAHFDIVGDGEERPPAVTIRVCNSLSCMLAGTDKLLKELDKNSLPDVRVVPALCMGRCDLAPVAEVGHRHVDGATVEALMGVIEKGDFAPALPSYPNLESALAAGGYAGLRACLDGKHDRDEIIALLSDAGLSGMGGAGFPTGRKWHLVRGEPAPRLMAVNADEGEPGTFKDRLYLETAPHTFLEGALIAAWVVEAETLYIYLRDEYPAAREILIHEIAALEEAGLSPHTRIVLRRGAGAYICGEESAMIESIEGKRGLPRHRPPYVAQVGLFGRPTLVNNVETLYWVPQILEKGADWFSGQGANGAKGLRSFSVSGRISQPGVKLAPAGITAQQLIDEHCGGMVGGHTFKAYLPGGASGGILPASMADIPLDFGTLEPHGCFVGSHAVVVLSDKDDLKDVVQNLLRFFEDESCGQCTPCRNGTEKAVKLMGQGNWDREIMGDLAHVMGQASICGLGQAAPNPILSLLKHFPEEAS